MINLFAPFFSLYMYLSAGPPIGGLLYSLGGKGLPFFILAGLFVVAFGLYSQ